MVLIKGKYRILQWKNVIYIRKNVYLSFSYFSSLTTKKRLLRTAFSEE